MQFWLCFWSWFFKIFSGGGEMNKVHGKTIFTHNGLSIQKLWQETFFFVKNGQLLSLPGTREKNFSFPIRVVNFCEAFGTCSPSSLGQDLTVKIYIYIFFILFILFSFGLLELKMAVLNVFWEKRPLSFRS
jgi:hypothetical protein